MSIASKIKSSPRLKKLVHWSITPARNPRPRLWIRLLVNRFYHKRGKGSVIRSNSRIDVFPWNRFEIGELTTIESFVVINNGSGHVLMGDRVRVGIGSVVLGPVTMGNGSGIGQHVFIAGFSHGYEDGEKNSSVQPLVI
ncbi:MAG: acyltransferase, partial [Chitinophagaceae bacterium]